MQGRREWEQEILMEFHPLQYTPLGKVLTTWSCKDEGREGRKEIKIDIGTFNKKGVGVGTRNLRTKQVLDISFVLSSDRFASISFHYTWKSTIAEGCEKAS